MKTKPLPDSDPMQPGKPETMKQGLLTGIGSGGICKECLNEEFDTCVCPEPKVGE